MTNSKAPFYFKVSIILVGFAVLVAILYLGKEIIIPLIYALLMAILLNPVVNYLHGKRVNRIVAILISELAAMVLLAALVYFISSQLSQFGSQLPQLKIKFNELMTSATHWVSVHLKISDSKVTSYLNDSKKDALNNSGVLMSKTLLTLGNLLGVMFLMPVYTFMFLFYKPLLLEFMRKAFSRAHHDKVADVLLETKMLIQNYLVGLLIEAGIVATLNTVALMIIGVQYAILLGIIGALLNIIPYIGGLVAVALAMIMGLLTSGTDAALWVLLAYIVIQFLDNNLLVPKIVASRVQINALISIIVVLVGNKIWGVPGMFLSIPLTALIKVVFDRINELQPWGFLLGDNMPSPAKQMFNFTAIRKRKQSEKGK